VFERSGAVVDLPIGKEYPRADSWMQYGKASECKIEGNKITFYVEDGRDMEKKMIPLLTYEIV